MKTAIVFTLFASLFLSCEKRELPVSKDASLTLNQVEMGSNYQYQIWFSLSAKRVVSTNLKTDWDLCFESSATGWHLVLNGSKSMRVYKTPFTSLEEVKDTLGLAANGQADAPSGNLDSTAFGDWRSKNPVYIVDRGYDEKGKRIGFLKLKVLTVNEQNYEFRWASLAANQSTMQVVPKEPNRNFVGFSFSSQVVLTHVEPQRTDFDLCFTTYTHLFLDPLQYYQVTGVLTNSYKTRVGRLPKKTFSSVSLADTLSCRFSSARNVIGYDWKDFNLEKNEYTVNLNLCYIIQDSYGFYYKLHFVDFYSDSGIKGSPKFEFQRL